MDPYLEGYLWPDVHHRLATQISEQLTPLLRPRYVARIEVQVVTDEAPEAEIGIMYPDVEITRSPRRDVQPPVAPVHGGALVAEAPITTPASVVIALPAIEVRLASVEIRDAAQNQLITCIEILSPINKREPGLGKYRAKLQQLRAAGVHVLEVDLLRRGQRLHPHPRIPVSAYRVMLIRAAAHLADVWAINLADPLPIAPAPLRPPDEDVPLDLGLALHTLYDRAAYDLSINYGEAPPPPALSPEEAAWMQQLLSAP
jgi:hypothetical protein